ncbi:MAG: energy transducer TonB [Bacteroidota bacterium]|nr:energy transducer TonB [Bacteroidota bacterium]MDE2834958.1 energy transducer TonB [Bacteroidota bacterium]MDE2958098.1 energy transducer TonB [Bacteroidota bacterium]
MALNKTPKADLKRTYGFFVQVGMILSLALLIVAFRMNLDRGEGIEIDQTEQVVVQMEEVLQTKQIQKPPPPPRPPVPVEVPNDEILDDIDLDLDASLDLSDPILAPPPPPPAEEEEEEEEPEIFVIVEQDPTIIGGQEWLMNEINYPEIARKANVEGRVFLQFIVDTEGKVSDAIVTRGIGAGCDEEALRVISKATFVPGRQRGRAVKVRMSMSILFKLR